MNFLPENTVWPGGIPAAPAVSQPSPAQTIYDRPYHAKRPHKKSRAGCVNCKTRKVKCNEERPRCRACTLRRETCVYPSPQHISAPSNASSRSHQKAAAGAAASSTAASSTIPPSYGSSSSSSDDGLNVPSRVFSRNASPGVYHSGGDLPAGDWSLEPSKRGGGSGLVVEDSFNMIEEPFYLPPTIDQTDMKLLWFYTAKGFDAFAAEAGRQPKVDEILQVAIPRHAFTSRFLMDCLLALSALELQVLNQPIEPARVIMYRARAFNGYRKAIENATPETYPALLACSLLLCALSSEMFRDADSSPLYILDWMVVWRGISLIVKLIQPETLFNSGMSMLFARPPINLDNASEFIPNQLLYMVASIRSDEPDYMYKELYYETLKYLGSLYQELNTGIGRILNLRTVTWFTFLPKGFVDVARERHPRALVIIAHYLAFVKLCNKLWWMQGIADKEIGDIRDVLEEEWLAYIRAPLAVLETEDEIKIGKILLNNNAWKPEFFHDRARDDRPMDLSLVDNTGHSITFNGTWVQTDTGKQAVWNIIEPLDSTSAVFQHDEILGLRRLSLDAQPSSSST